MTARRWIYIVAAVAVACAAFFWLHARGVARRDHEVRELSARLKLVKARESLLLNEIQETAEASAKLRSKLEEVDSVLDNMNSTIASAHVHSEPIDMRWFELNQKQHELLIKDLAEQRKHSSDVVSAGEKMTDEEQRLAREIAALRDSCWLRHAFW